MGKKKFNTEQIISILREAEMLHSKGETVQSICRNKKDDIIELKSFDKNYK